MRNLIWSLPWILTLFASSAARSSNAQEIHQGRWAGEIRVEGERVPIRLELGSSSGRVSIPRLGWYDLSLRFESSRRLSLEVYGQSATLTLPEAGSSLGAWQGFGAAGEVRLERLDREGPRFEALEIRLRGEGWPKTGTLILPRGPGPFPAVVWTHGSGPLTQEDPLYRSLAFWFVEQGVASFLYDKRPPAPGASFETLADDAIRAVVALREHDALLPEVIGVGGLSQGGWVAPLAAARSESVAFVVGLSAPGISPAEQNLFNQRNKVLLAGFSAAEADAASRVLESVYDYLRSGVGREAARDALEESSREPWFESAYELTHWRRAGLPSAPWVHRRALDHDARAVWRQVRVPVACLWGEADALVPAEKSREIIREALEHAGVRAGDTLLEVIPQADHSLRLPPRGPWTLGELPRSAGRIPSFIRALQTERPRYPSTRVEKEREVRHGVEIEDRFRWLERDSDERRAWVKAQDDLTRARLPRDSELKAIEKRLRELHQATRHPVPVPSPLGWFLDGQTPGVTYSDIRLRNPDTGAETILVSPHAHPASPHEAVDLSVPRPSPDGEVLLYGASSRSLRPGLRLFDVKQKRELEAEVLPVSFRPWSVSWSADSRSVLYVEGRLVKRHRLGTAVSTDEVIFESPLPASAALAVRASADGEAVFVTVFTEQSDSNRVFWTPTPGRPDAWIELLEEVPGGHQFIEKSGSRAFLFTTHGAPKGRVWSVDLEEDPNDWTEVVPELAEAVWDGNHPIRPAVGLFEDRLVLLYGRSGRHVLRVFDLDGAQQHEVLHPALGFNESGLIGRRDRPFVYYDVQSMTDPGSAFELDVRSGEIRRIGASAVPFDPSDFILEQHEYSSLDGTPVPIFLAYCRGSSERASRAVLMLAGGAAGIASRPMYLPHLQLWLESGGLFALPGIRGGGENGKDWHDGGRRRNKPVAVRDFLEAARWLVERGWSEPHRIGVVGMSLPAPVAASALIQHPGEFGAGLIQISQLDMLRHTSMVEEFGDPSRLGDFEALMHWSPYHRVTPAVYPPVLIQVGDDDRITLPFHGYKTLAALQADQLGRAPILLQVAWGAGHSQGFGLEQRIETRARQHVFLRRALRLTLGR